MSTDTTTLTMFPMPVSVRIGICRKEGCQHYNKFGPMGAMCIGNHGYFTRHHTHRFETLQSHEEKMRANDANLGQVIGVCNKIQCYSIGYPSATCEFCLDNGLYNKYVNIENQSLLHVFVERYKEDNRRLITHLNRLYGAPPPQHFMAVNAGDDDSSITNTDDATIVLIDPTENNYRSVNQHIYDDLSFYTPSNASIIQQEALDATIERQLDENYDAHEHLNQLLRGSRNRSAD